MRLFGTSDKKQDQIYQRGYDAYKQKDYAAALPLLTSAAKKGHVQAQFYLGVCYSLGYGTPRKPAEALLWYERAAAQGNRDALYNCGQYYLTGAGSLL